MDTSDLYSNRGGGGGYGADDIFGGGGMGLGGLGGGGGMKSSHSEGNLSTGNYQPIDTDLGLGLSELTGTVRSDFLKHLGPP